MVKSMNHEILKKLDEILDFIKNSQTYQDYQFLAKKLEQNLKATEKIAEIKKLQKQLVKKEVEGKDTSLEDAKIKKLVESLNQIPLYVDFLEKQEELNDIYQLLHLKLEDYFEHLFQE